MLFFILILLSILFYILIFLHLSGRVAPSDVILQSRKILSIPLGMHRRSMLRLLQARVTGVREVTGADKSVTSAKRRCDRICRILQMRIYRGANHN